MARPRKYTAASLKRGVDEYFRKISRTVTLKEQCNTGRKDGWGHWVYEMRDVVNDQGETVTTREFALPPTVGGLCAHLGIHRSTWADYCDGDAHPEFAGITEYARDVMRDYLETALLTRGGKDLRGVIFSLQNNFGYRERHEMELGPRSAKAVASAGLTMEEREALLREMGQAFAREVPDDGGEQG